jgi:hypothetical protein
MFFLSQRRQGRQEVRVLVVNPNTSASSAPLRDYICLFSRKDAKKFVFLFVVTPDTFACFAPWRELICFFLSPRRQGRQEVLVLVYCYPKHLSELSASARLNFYFSRKDARKFVFLLLLPQTPLRALRLGESHMFFLSQRRRGRRDFQCLFCCYPKHLCVLCVLARLSFLFLSQRRQGCQEVRVLVCCYPKHLCLLCALARAICFFSRRDAEAAESFNVRFVLTPDTFACFASSRD